MTHCIPLILPLPARRPPPPLREIGYSDEEVAGEIQTEVAAQHARLDAFIIYLKAVFSLWLAVKDATADAYCRASRRQRGKADDKKAKSRQAEGTRYFSARGYYGRAVKILLTAPTYDPIDTNVKARLKALHLNAAVPTIRKPRCELPGAPVLFRTLLLKTAKKT